MEQPIAAPPGSSSTRLWPAILAVVLMVLVAAVVAFVIARSSVDDAATAPEVLLDDAAPVRLEPVTYQSPEPFTESVVTADAADLERLTASSSSATTGGPVRGDTALLYGTRRSRPLCDVARLAQLVTADDQVRASWAAAADVAPDDVESTVMGLTSVVLTADTAVTNHVYRSGSPSAYQSVLQRGTPVLIDQVGTPRAQCSCGNPLLAPEIDRSAEFEGPTWDGFDPDAVIDVEPAEAPTGRVTTIDIDSDEQVDTSVGGLAPLDGFLAVNRRGVDVVDWDGVATTVIDRPVSSVFDDGNGGLVYTLARPSADPNGDGYEDGPPDDPEESVIWHLPAGASEASELIGIEAEGGWNDLLSVGQLGDRTFAVFASLTVEQVYEETSTPTGPVSALDLTSGERTVLVENGFDWEQGVGAVSFGGDRLAMSYGYDMPDWLLFGADLQSVPNACSLTDGRTEDRYAFVEQNCPWRGSLNGDGNLVFFGSALANEFVVGEEETIETLDLTTGTFLPSVVADFAADTVETSSAVTQVTDDRLVAQFRLSSEPERPSGRILDTTDGTFVGLPDALMASTRSVWILTAPVVRPVDTDPDDADPVPTPRPQIDAMNMTLPAGTCSDYSDRGAPSVTLVDGTAQTSDDYTSEEFVSFSLTPEATTWVDLDNDGGEELVVSVMCNWGGSGWANSIVALDIEEDGSATMIAEPLVEYGRTTRSADELDSDEPGVLVINGGEWLDSDAFCCPSSTFTARWMLDGDRWTEL